MSHFEICIWPGAKVLSEEKYFCATSNAIIHLDAWSELFGRRNSRITLLIRESRSQWIQHNMSSSNQKNKNETMSFKVWTCSPNEYLIHQVLENRHSNTQQTILVFYLRQQHCLLPSALRHCCRNAAQCKFEICSRKYFKTILIDPWSWTRALILNPSEARPRNLPKVVRVSSAWGDHLTAWASKLLARSRLWGSKQS